MLELTALPSLDRVRWESWVRQADVLLGSMAAMLSTFATGCSSRGSQSFLQSLPDIVWVGLSAGSMVMTPRVGEAFVETKPPITGDDKGARGGRLLDLPAPGPPGVLQKNTMAESGIFERPGPLGAPAYAIDDQTASKVVDGTVDVVSARAAVKLLTPSSESSRIG